MYSSTSVKPSKAYSRGSVVMVDEIMNDSPSKFRFPDAGLRVMVTSHFGPKTRLRMASRLIITEVHWAVVATVIKFVTCMLAVTIVIYLVSVKVLKDFLILLHTLFFIVQLYMWTSLKKNDNMIMVGANRKSSSTSACVLFDLVFFFLKASEVGASR